jgi:transmembrane sensor
MPYFNSMKQESMDQSIDLRALNEAAEWLVKLNASDATEQDSIACELWRMSSQKNIQAWALAEQFLKKFDRLPPQLAMPALIRSKRNDSTNPTRRAALGKLTAMLAVIPAGWGAWRVAETRGLLADHHTATGEQRKIQLADGSQITLNTATAIDVQFDKNQRLINLRSGEVLIETAPDNTAAARPFVVVTSQGRMQALGTRFNVRQQYYYTHLAVLEGAVRIVPTNGTQQRIINAGEQTSFTASSIQTAITLEDNITAWNQGMLVADKTRLEDFAVEISRYRSGILRISPVLANLKVSGAYPLNDTNKTLDMLASTYALQVQVRLGGYWVTLTPL